MAILTQDIFYNSSLSVYNLLLLIIDLYMIQPVNPYILFWPQKNHAHNNYEYNKNNKVVEGNEGFSF